MLYALLGLNIVLISLVVFLLFRQPKPQDNTKMLQELKQSFESMSFKTLSEQTRLGEQTLEEKKKLIDQQLEHMKGDLAKIQASLTSFDKESRAGFDSVTKHLKISTETTGKLQDVTSQLKEVLKSTKARGQWGERMAEDVLNLAGFIENVNYRKQKAQGSGSKPDFAFLLPKGQVVNMDVKFPFDNYLAYVEAGSDIEKENFKKKFLSDVKEKIKQVTTKDYISPEENTVDYVLLFIPNEQVYAFINDSDRTILDEALKKKVIVCSPLTLYAVLAVIRQAMENFSLEKTAKEILQLMEAFYKQWEMYVRSFDTLGEKLDSAKDEYNKLTSTRRNQLERPLREIENLRKQKGIEGEKNNLLE
jgi:DNA recombination protein RmuC